MASIRERGYELPAIHAQLYSQTYTTGTNTPIVVRGYNENTGNDVDAIVKMIAARRMSVEASVNELIAAFIAKEWELSVVEPAIINLSQEFVETLRGKSIFKIAANSIGINVGSIYVDDLRQLVINDKLSSTQKEHAKKIFCYDAVIMNSDRTFDKPNMITDGKKITILDHEASFSFLRIIGGYKEPWNFDDHDKNVLRNHVLYHKLKDSSLPRKFLDEKIDLLDEDFWHKVRSIVPEGWQSDQIDKIQAHLDEIMEHKAQFITELERVLA